MIHQMLTDLSNIKSMAEEKEQENDAFRIFLKQQDGNMIDALVNQLNQEVTNQVDCTQCGNCCKQLMIHVEEQEACDVAARLNISKTEFKSTYIEVSGEGQMLMNTIPCSFLTGTICSVYQNRFSECREFPHLHKPGFNQRLFGTLMYYAICPIIFNVVELLKKKLNYSRI